MQQIVLLATLANQTTINIWEVVHKYVLSNQRVTTHNLDLLDLTKLWVFTTIWGYTVFFTYPGGLKNASK